MTDWDLSNPEKDNLSLKLSLSGVWSLESNKSTWVNSLFQAKAAAEVRSPQLGGEELPWQRNESSHSAEHLPVQHGDPAETESDSIVSTAAMFLYILVIPRSSLQWSESPDSPRFIPPKHLFPEKEFCWMNFKPREAEQPSSHLETRK